LNSLERPRTTVESAFSSLTPDVHRPDPHAGRKASYTRPRKARAMKQSVFPRQLPAHAESAEAAEGFSVLGEGIGLGALLVLLIPVSLAAWAAIGLAVYRALT
jgi:hypothetical protein